MRSFERRALDLCRFVEKRWRQGSGKGAGYQKFGTPLVSSQVPDHASFLTGAHSPRFYPNNPEAWARAPTS